MRAGRVRARGARRAGQRGPPPLAPPALPARRSRHLFGRQGGGDRGPSHPSVGSGGWGVGGGCRPGWGPARAGRGRAAGRRGVSLGAGRCGPGRRVRPRGAARAGRGTFRGRSCSLPGAPVAQRACPGGPRPACAHYPRFAFGVSSEATWVVTALLSSAEPTRQQPSFSYEGPSHDVGGPSGPVTSLFTLVLKHERKKKKHPQKSGETTGDQFIMCGFM